MKTEYIVCDQQGERSRGGKDAENLDSFTTFRAAEKRAKEIAGYSPGETIAVYERVAEVKAPVGKIESGRKYPIEHYS